MSRTDHIKKMYGFLQAHRSPICCHRDPETGAQSGDPTLYRELTEHIRSASTDGASERMQPIADCLPEICTLDCGTMNLAEADYVMTNTPGMLRAMGGMIAELGVQAEIEAFDTGHLCFARQLLAEGVLPPPVLVQLCMGVPWGAPDDLNTLMAMVGNVPEDWHWSARVRV